MKTMTLCSLLCVSLLVSACGGLERQPKAPAVPTSELTAAMSAPGLVVVDFYATWCGPCKAMKPIIEETEKALAGKVRFVAVDIDQQAGLAQEYKVEAVPTFVILKDGKVLDSKVGGMQAAKFKSWIDGFVQAAQ
jgi:thioredoxin